ncbi:MAG: beta-lactamase family protein [Alphaproteobacteria bacterium]|nr:beta-lactamase family protein [Alphaproteobacteria bacterium]MBV9695017.1 beta-lactamase family protein [Alphaproteobacteria bacterium]
MNMSGPIEGVVAPGFEPVRDAFVGNFERPGDYQECGAALAVFHRGQLVVDLWGGYADMNRSRKWTRDTLVNVWSTTKGVVATAVAMLVDRGLIRYEDNLAYIWPEFAEAGKQGITLAHVLSHQAGLPGFVEPTRIEDQYDWQQCCAKLVRQSPIWEPGTATSYHAMTYGWLAGEVIRRLSGKAVRQFIQDEIAAPMRADIFIGVPGSEEHRLAHTIPPRNPAKLPPLPQAAMMALTNPEQDASAANTAPWRKAEIPAANGHASAIALARLYTFLVEGGEQEGVRLLSPQVVDKMRAAATRDRTDMFLGFKDSWGMGMALNSPGIYGPNPQAFGHSGWGGSFACADPAARIAIGYVCNRMGPDLVGDPRTRALCNAVFSSRPLEAN